MPTINLGRVKGDKGDAASISLGTVSTGAPGSNAAVTNTGTPDAAVLNFAIPRGDKGETGSTGPANTLTIAGVTTGAPGSSASVSVGGTAPNQTLTFSIPRGDTGATGDKGDAGNAATISLGTVTTGDAGSSASATNSGTSSAAVINFTIPRGDKGDKGDTGNTGPTNSLTVDTVTTGAAGSNASVSIGGTAPNQTISFTIPRGEKGETGNTGPIGPVGPVGPEPSLNVTDNAGTAITLADTDNNKIVRCTASSAVTVTVPSTLASGFSCMVIQAGTGQVTFAAGSGATLNSFGNLLSTAGQHAPASLIRVGSGAYNLSGNLV